MIALVLRPEPGAGATCLRARALGLSAVAAPLFTLRPLAWGVPSGRFDAVMMTSANAVTMAGARLASLMPLPVYAVGARTAAAAREAGFAQVHAGSGDVAALIEQADAHGVRRLLHLAGRDRREVPHLRVGIVALDVYSADAADALPPAARAALHDGAVALLHSPRAAALFAHLVDNAGIARAPLRIAAISAAALAAAGAGWGHGVAAAVPTDAALLAAAHAMGAWRGNAAA